MRATLTVPLIAALVLAAAAAVRASPVHDQLLWAARQHIHDKQLDSAEAELRSALDLAPYQIDSSLRLRVVGSARVSPRQR